jgi:hypothetical protein
MSLEAIKTTKDEMALEDFIVDITGKVAQNIEEIQHLFKVDKFNKIKNLVASNDSLSSIWLIRKSTSICVSFSSNALMPCNSNK